MNAIERYNQMRDREQHEFECSSVGTAARHALNYCRKYVSPGAWVGDELKAALAAEYAFGRRMPAFYAIRALCLDTQVEASTADLAKQISGSLR